jgi:hypothetical protein
VAEQQKSFLTDLFKDPYHVGALIMLLVGIDYLQAIMLYDSRAPYLLTLFNCRYFAVALMVGGFLRHGLRHCWLLGASLTLVDAIFFVAQSEWILATPEWWYVRLPFFANAAFSVSSWLLACAWVHFSLWGMVLELLVFVCGLGVGAYHLVYQDAVEQWFTLLQSWLQAWQLNSAQTELIAANMAATMSASIVNSYILVPVVFVCVMALFMQSKTLKHKQWMQSQWYNYRVSWVAFVVSLSFYLCSLLALWALPYWFAYEVSWRDTGALAYLFDIAQFAPCVAGLSLMHLYVDISLASKKRFWRVGCVLLLFTMFYAFHQLFVWVGLADKLLDMRKRYNIVQI